VSGDFAQAQQTVHIDEIQRTLTEMVFSGMHFDQLVTQAIARKAHSSYTALAFADAFMTEVVIASL
jgi:hypothetical protein